MDREERLAQRVAPGADPLDQRKAAVIRLDEHRARHGARRAFTAVAAPPRGRRCGGRALGLGIALSLALHGALLWLVPQPARRPESAAAPLLAALLPAAAPVAAPAAPVPPRASNHVRPAAPLPKLARDRQPAPPVQRSEPAPSPTPAQAPSGPAAVLGAAPSAPPAATAATPPGTPAITLVPPGFDAAYLHNPKPSYPRAAVRMGLEGVVRIEVLVGADGRPRGLTLAHSSGHAVLDEAALEAVATWRFVPASRGGEAVAARVEVPIRFMLNEE
jgi:protein TonB